MEKDASREFMENLPELEPGKTFCFACHPEVPCFNRCCAELTLPLTPYDVLRLRRHMNNMPSEAFLNDFTRMRTFPDTGFPLPLHGADGDFGAETEQALRQFQQKSGLSASGAADAETLAALRLLNG